MGNKKKQTNEFDNYFDDDFEVVYEDLEDLGSYLSEDSSDNNDDYDDYDGYDGDTDYYDDDDYDDYDDLEDYEYSPEELEYIKQQSNLDRVDIESIADNVQNEYDNTESVPNGFEDTEGDGRRGFDAILNSDETLTITSKEKR